VPGAGWGWVLGTDTLTELRTVCLTTLILALLPFEFFEGHTLMKNMKWTWLGLYAAAIFAFVVIVAQPSFVVAHAAHGGFVMFLVVFIAIALATCLTWLYFRRMHRPSKPLAAAAPA
jgi:hypothetical protein